MVKARKYVLRRAFDGIPKREDYEIVEYELPPLKAGEVMVKTEWISVDPYLRLYSSAKPLPYDQFSYQVGEVIETRNPDYPKGTKVVSHIGWCDYGIVNFNDGFFNKPEKLPDLKGLPASLAVGAVGMPGVTAYFGLLDVCQPKSGETVVVTGAAGAVGALAGQIAKVKGCKVIGFAGSESKVKWLENEIGFDKVINYKTADITKALKEAAPQGVDCYFDNVGGEISSLIIAQMNTRGRVAVCGSISAYNEGSGVDDLATLPKATIIQPFLVLNQIKVEGIHCTRWLGRWHEAYSQMVQWIKGGKIKAREHVTEGFDNVFDAFVGMLRGENTGKAVVKV